ncbi:hypothetical protein Tco_1437911 [Tanacetum coccineum]
MRKINFKRAVTQKFKEYDHNPKALTSINNSKAIDKAIHAKVLTKMKKLIPTNVPRVLANFVKPHMDLKLKLFNRIHESKTHPTNQKLYDTLYESIILNQETLNAQNAETSFHKSPSTIAIAKKIKEIIQKDELIIADLEGARLEKLKQQYKNDVELEYHVDQLKEEVLSEAQWNSDEGDVSKPRSFKRHMSKSSKPHPNFYNNDFYYLVCLSTEDKYTTSLTKHYAARYHIQGIEDMISERWSKEVHCYQIEALNGIHHWEDARQDFFKA